MSVGLDTEHAPAPGSSASCGGRRGAGLQAASTAPRRALRPALHDGEQGGEPQGDSRRLYGVTGVSVEFLHGRESGEGGRARKAGRKGNVGCDLRPKESREPRPGPAVGSPPYRGRGVDLAISGPALVPDPGPRCRRRVGGARLAPISAQSCGVWTGVEAARPPLPLAAGQAPRGGPCAPRPRQRGPGWGGPGPGGWGGGPGRDE